MIELKIDKELAEMRLDRALLKQFEGLGFGAVQVMCRKGRIKVDGKKAKPNQRLEQGQMVTLPDVTPSDKPQAPQINFTNQQLAQVKHSILQDGEKMLVLNKPAGIPVQAGSGHDVSIDRLMEALWIKEARGDVAPKLVHRLDKGTSGCLLMAKTRAAAAKMTELFKGREVQKTYLALVSGKLPALEGEITAALSKFGEEGEQKMALDEDGKRAKTEFKSLGRAGQYNLVLLKPSTGRTHQLRAHLALLDTPIVGDGKYGGIKCELPEVKLPKDTFFLHAWQLELPKNAGLVDWPKITAPLPKHFQDIVELFEWQDALDNANI